MAKSNSKSASSKTKNLRENRFENMLAFMAAGVIGVSVLSMFAVIVFYFLGAIAPKILQVLPLVGFPIGFVLIFALLITSIVRKSRGNKQ